MRRTYGRDISAYEGRFLEKSFAKRQAATPAQSASAYLHLLSEDRAEANLFLDSLNITYSEFFRSPLTFAHLEQLILPNLLSEAEREIVASHPRLRPVSLPAAAYRHNPKTT